MIRKIVPHLVAVGVITLAPVHPVLAVPAYDTPPEKVEEYKQAAQKGDPEAQFNLACLTRLGWAGIKEDKDKSRELLLKSAEQGYAEAQIWLAGLSLSGEITGKYSTSQAAKWYKKAAEQGSKEAYFQLGCLHQEGNEVMSFFKEIDKGKTEIEPLEQKKELCSGLWLKAGLSKSRVESLEAFFTRISKGDWKAHKDLSDFFSEKDLKELKPDMFTFFHLAQYEYHLFDANLEKAKGGDTKAMVDVADSYKYPGCPGHPIADIKEQLRWLDKAAQKGSVQALYELGSFFSQNDETKDPKKSFAYFMQAAEKGHAAAMCSLALIHESENDLTESTRWMIKAAEAGDKASWFYVGHRYQNGKGVPQNFVKAYAWFSISSSDEKEGTESPARNRLKVLAEKMPPEQIAEAQELAAQIWDRLEKKLSAGQSKSADEKAQAQVILDLERSKLRSSPPR